MKYREIADGTVELLLVQGCGGSADLPFADATVVNGGIGHHRTTTTASDHLFLAAAAAAAGVVTVELAGRARRHLLSRRLVALSKTDGFLCLFFLAAG